MKNPDDQNSPAEPQKRKPGRPASGKAKSRADIQRDYRRRQSGNVTNNRIEALDENLTLRAQLLRVMDQLEETEAKLRVEFEKGEKARRRVRELEKKLVATGERKKAGDLDLPAGH